MSQYPNGPQQPYQNQPPGSNPGYPPQQPGYPPYPQQPGYPPPGYQQPPMQQPKKKFPIFKVGCGGLVVLVVLFIIIAIASGGKSNTTTTPSIPGNSNGSNQQQAPSKQGTWQTTHTYTGNGAKKTESFTVGDDWKIQWTCNPGSIGMDAPLFITPYKTDGNAPLDMGSQTSCKSGQDTKGETEEHQGGTFYLDVNSGIDWTITIQELK